MSEAAVRHLVWPTHACSERLARAVAQMAAHIAELLRTVPAAERDLTSSCAFLAAMGEHADVASAYLQRSHEPDPIDRLAAAYGFSPLDRQLLILTGMAEENEGIASVFASLHPAGESRASAGLAAQLFCGINAQRRDLREHLEIGAAVKSGAVRVIGGGPLFTRTLEVAPALWSALHGIDTWPAALAPDQTPAVTSGLGEWLASPLAQRARAAMRSSEPRVVLFTADDLVLAAQRAAALALHAEVPAVRLTIAPAHGAEMRQWAELHVIARGLLPIVSLVPSLDGARPADTDAPFAMCPGTVVVCGAGAWRPADARRSMLEIPVERIASRSRVAMWREALPELASEAERLSMVYTVEPDGAAVLADDVRALAALEGRAPNVEDVASSVRARGKAGTVPGVSLRRATARWEQLVLPKDRLAQLQEVVHRLRHQPRVLDDWGFMAGRGGARGVRVLFAGPPGTGKTLAAEVLANTLGVDLLVVDLSKVVSKWLGETEKNLSAVFDAAEQSQAVLLFDEADSLFGRRTEVSDAHDRYANLETAYLLTRLERLEGLAVLSTNLQRNIDPAFVRRFEFMMDFDEPGEQERLALWRCHLPPGAPLAHDVDIGELAALYPLAGGLIRNATVAAAFQAATAGTSITRTLLVRAIRREYQKSGRAYPGAPAGMAET